jgi:Uma2 family endonuclease
MVAAPKLSFTFRDYLAVDSNSTVKHEFLDGLILGMAGGTPDHARLAMAVGTLLSGQLDGKRCAVFSEALRVRATATGFAGYPDVTVVCDALARDPDDRNTITNPSLVVEVLSPSTAEYDRGEKFRHYQTMDSLQHVVFVAYDSPQIEVWTRSTDAWLKRSYGAGERAELPAIDCVLAVDVVFRDPLAG